MNNYIELPAIQCTQRKAVKVMINEQEIINSNINGMGNEVGVITNRVTSQMEVQAQFNKNSKEYNIMNNRILCGQLYQQNSIDKIKGIIASDMPNDWYNKTKALENNTYNLCAYRKPYFMIYIYKKLEREYKNYIKNCREKSLVLFGIELEEVLVKNKKNDNENEFCEKFEKYLPVGKNDCTMNRICFAVENEMQGSKSTLKKQDFDYNFLKWGCKIKKIKKDKMANLFDNYKKEVKLFASRNYLIKLDKEHSKTMREEIKNRFKEQAEMICEDDKERLDIILDLCYNTNENKQFCWDCVGELIIEKLFKDSVDK